MAKLLPQIPRFVIALLLVVAIVNLLIGVFLRYVMVDITDWLDIDPIRFTWVEEVGEFTLAWLTLLGAAVGVRERMHFTLHVLPLTPAVRRWIDRLNHVLIAAFGLVTAWYGVGLCAINTSVKSAGLEISLAILYGSSVAGGVLIAIYAISMIIAPPKAVESDH